MKFAEYSLSGKDVLKDGHTMFPYDIVRELNRKSFLEEKISQEFKEDNYSTSTNRAKVPICTTCGQELNVLIEGGPGYCHKCKSHVPYKQ